MPIGGDWCWLMLKFPVLRQGDWSAYLARIWPRDYQVGLVGVCHDCAHPLSHHTHHQGRLSSEHLQRPSLSPSREEWEESGKLQERLPRKVSTGGGDNLHHEICSPSEQVCRRTVPGKEDELNREIPKKYFGTAVNFLGSSLWSLFPAPWLFCQVFVPHFEQMASFLCQFCHSWQHCLSLLCLHSCCSLDAPHTKSKRDTKTNRLLCVKTSKAWTKAMLWCSVKPNNSRSNQSKWDNILFVKFIQSIGWKGTSCTRRTQNQASQRDL